MVTNQIIEHFKDLIEFYGLQTDPLILSLFRNLMLNPADKKTVYQLSQRIKQHPEAIAKQLSGTPFYTPLAQEEKDGDIEIGTDEKNRPTYINISELKRHVIIAGSTGAGKTTLIRKIMLYLSQKGIKFLSLDFKRDTRQLLPYIPNLLILTVCEKPNFKINPLEIWPNTLPLHQDSCLVSCLCEACFLMEGSSSLILDQLTQLRNQHSEITLHDLYKSIKNAKLKTPRALGWRDSALRALQSIIIMFHEMLDCNKGIPLWEIIEKYNVVIELDRAGDFKSFWGSLILTYYLNYKISSDIRKD
jgi:hypothetical protein